MCPLTWKIKLTYKASKVCKLQPTTYMAQMKRNCLTEENIKGFLKMEVH